MIGSAFASIPDEGLASTRKLRLYERHGVREYWLADPAAETLEVYRLTPGGSLALQASLSHAAGDVLETPLLAGLRIASSEIFE